MANTHQTPTRDRVMAGIGTTAMMAGLGYALLVGLIVHRGIPHQDAPLVLTIDAPPPPPPREHIQPQRSMKKAGAAAPRNLRNKPTEVVAPKPVLPAPPPIKAAPVAGLGLAALAGASNLPGPGTGAGGQGNGMGSGGSGNGEGAGDTPPEQIKGSLDYSDIPSALRQQGVEGSVGVRYAINVDGRVSNCSITSSSGNTQLDAITCALIEKRFRFRPSYNGEGQPVRSQFLETHSWIMDRRQDQP